MGFQRVLNVPVAEKKSLQNFPTIISGLEREENVPSYQCPQCKTSSGATRRAVYDFSGTRYLLLRFIIFRMDGVKIELRLENHNFNDMPILRKSSYGNYLYANA